MVLKLSNIVSFWQFSADVSNKSKAVRTVYVYPPESSCFILLKKALVIMLWLTV